MMLSFHLNIKIGYGHSALLFGSVVLRHYLGFFALLIVRTPDVRQSAS
jgi:hypothetical protein